MKKSLLTLTLVTSLASATLQAQESVPWTQPFAGTVANVCAAQEKDPTNRAWTFTANQLRIQGLANRQTNSHIWFPNQGLSVEAGHTYKISVEAKQAPYQTDETKQASICVGIYETPASSAPHTDVINVGPIGSDYVTYTGFFNAETTTTVYVDLNTQFYNSTSYTYFQNLTVTEVNPAAPGGVTGLTASPDESAMQVTLSFTAPTTTIGGQPLADISGITIFRDGHAVTTLSPVTPGEEMSFVDNVFQPGIHNYSVMAANSAGDGEDVFVTTTLGSAAPAPTKYVTANYNADGSVTIDWSALTTLAEGAVYTVTASDGRVVAEATSALSVSDNPAASATPVRLHYVVTDGSGATVGTTNTLSLFNQVPFLPTFTSSAGLGEFTYDRSNSNVWQINNTDLTARKSYYQADNANQDGSWLISPGLMLSAGKVYRVEVEAYTSFSPMKFHVNAGKGNNASDMALSVIQPTAIEKTPGNGSGFFKPEEDGQYFFGVNGTIAESLYSEYLNIACFNVTEADGTLPAEPSDLNVVFDPADSSKARITFNAPSVDLAGAGLTRLDKIEVYKDNQLFQTLTEGVAPGAALGVDVTVTSGEENTYLIVAYNEAGRGESAQIQVIIIQPPYVQDFNSENSLSGYTLIDMYDAGFGWRLFNNRARCYHTSGHGTDAWLITPPIHLEAGKFYHLAYNGWANINGTSLGVHLGKHPTVEAMTQTVTADYGLDTGETIYGSVKHEYFTVDETGEYHIGYHATAPDISSEIYLDNLILSAPIDGATPSKGILEVIPDQNGAKTAQVRFTIPRTSLDGEDLPAGEEVSVTLCRNLEVIGGGPLSGLPGQTISTVDEVGSDNVYLYSGTAANSKGEGPTDYFDMFVGLNRPSYPIIKSMVENINRFGELTIQWEAPVTDTDGYPFNPLLATYDLSEIVENRDGTISEAVVKNGISETSYTFTVGSEEAMQTAHRYVLRASNSKGERSQGFLSEWVVVGKPFGLPYEESFAGNTIQTPIITTTVDGTAHWGFMPEGTMGVTSADNDGGFLGLEAMFADCSASFLTPKVSLADTDNPVLNMMVYNYENSPCENRLEFFVRTLEGDWQPLSANTVDFYAAHNQGWQKLSLPLDDYAGEVISLKVTGTSVSHNFTMVDKLVIRRQPLHDLSITSASIPALVHKGKETPVKVTVKNNGLVAENDYSVTLYIDGEKHSAVGGSEIAPDQELEFILPYTLDIFDTQDWRAAEVYVDFEADEEMADNSSLEVTIRNIPETLAPVEALTGLFTEDGVALTWEAPTPLQGGGSETTDDFESYESWSETPSPWLTYDADGKLVALVQNADIPGLENATKSFWIFDSTLDDIAGEALFAPRSGDKMIVSICPHDQSMQDDWLISPLLTGDPQTISFFARSFMASYVTNFEVRYSDGSLALGDFSLAGSKNHISGDWTEYSFELPEGARRFAIRNISNGGFFLMVDDVTYTPAPAEDSQLTGFNVYYGTELLATLPASEPRYTDTTAHPDGAHIYNVTALYPMGESNPEEVLVQISAIDGVHGRDIRISGADGHVIITGAEGLRATICTPDGRVFFNDTVPADGLIASPAGVVLVNIAGSPAKVTVR